MNLKYYLRGLGTGIFVTALIMTVSFEIHDAKKDIKTDTVLQETSSEETSTEEVSAEETSAEETSAEKTSAEEASSEETTTEEISEDETTEEETTTEEVSTEEETEEQGDDEVVYIDIYAGMSSNQVCRKLEELGVIDDDNDFNEYLYSRRLENQINVGYFSIGKNASYEEIAAVITG